MIKKEETTIPKTIRPASTACSTQLSLLFPATGTNCLTLLTFLRHLINHDLSFFLHRSSANKTVLCAHPGLKIFEWLHYSQASEVHLISTIMEFLGANSICLSTQMMLSHRLDTSFGRRRLEINMRGTSFLQATMKQLNSSRKPQRMLATC